MNVDWILSNTHVLSIVLIISFLIFCAKTALYCFDKFHLVKLFNSSSMNLYDLLIFC